VRKERRQRFTIWHPFCCLDKRVHHSIGALFLYKSDVDAIARGLRKGRDPHDWVLHNTKKPETFDKIVVVINRCSRIAQAQSQTFECAAMLMDGPFEERIARTIAFLMRGQ